jgi:hypothetical protein
MTAAQRDITVIDEQLYLHVFARPATTGRGVPPRRPEIPPPRSST